MQAVWAHLRVRKWKYAATRRMFASAVKRSTRKRSPDYLPRRWVVEVCHSWFNRFRKLLVRFEKTDRSYMALVMLASAIIAFRNLPAQQNIIYG